MMDYITMIQEIHRYLAELHKATTANNFEVAEQYSENLVRLSHSLQHTLTTMNAEERE
jgi:hypothetical protein